ncbi:MAG: glycoside hydrolase family 2 protein [Candidatus Sumerlaeota bacterium]
MLRTFDEHAIRRTLSLDGWWDFITEPERKDRTKLPKTYTRRVYTPLSWETLPGLENYRGKAWFRRTIEGHDGPVRLVFGGVSHTAKVFIDKKQVGFHYDAFTPFEVVLPKLKAGEHDLVVEVTNAFGEESALHTENDYYSYGGLTRPTMMECPADVFISRMGLTPQRKGRGWALKVHLRLWNTGKKMQRRGVSIQIEGQNEPLHLGTFLVNANATMEVTKNIPAPDGVEMWTTDNPKLYYVTARVLDEEKVMDDLIDRVGFRKVEVKGQAIMLNDKPIRLRGYNRHEDHPHYGCAIPLEAMVQDLVIMRDLNCNFVRTSHYPNDMRFLDLCDEMGFYVWEESHARAVSFDQPKFLEQQETSTREMIDWHVSHPSIIIWGCMNECESETKRGRGVYEKILKLIKRLDPSRPMTFASCRNENDICFDLVDIVSVNRYDAWYRGGMDTENVQSAWEQFHKFLKSPKSGAKGKPIILSEFGAGAIYGCRQRQKAKWTEEFQVEALDACLQYYLHHPDIVGACIWQFCDVRVTPHWFNGRPRTMNNKGTVDEYRRPKLAYDTVKQRMLEAVEKYDK